MQRRIISRSIIAIVLLIGIARVNAAEWPKWMGPAGDGISTDPIAQAWPTDGPKKVWSKQIGLGFSSVVGLNGKIYALAMVGQNDVLSAIDAGTGNVDWAQSYPVTHKADQPQAKNEQNGLPVPEASPTIDGTQIFTYGGGSDLVCRNLSDGKEVWHLNVLDATHAEILQWNAASSPLVTDQFVYVQGGQGAAIAVGVERTTGKIIWKAENGIGGYAAPILVTVDGTQQLIVFAGKGLFGLDPITGKTLWNYPWETAYDVNAATPTYHEGHLFITTAYGHGGAMFQLHSTGVKLEWKGPQISSKYQPCILDNGKLYGNSSGRLKCLKWPTSTALWSSNKVDLGEGGSFVIDGSRLIALSERGKLSLVELGPSGAKVLNESQLFDYDKVWSSPVIYHGKLYIKGKDELVCLEISK